MFPRMPPRKNHRTSMSQPERGFWRDVYVGAELPPDPDRTDAEEARLRANKADAAVAEHRRRVTWSA
jgi:hypothetical protein